MRVRLFVRLFVCFPQVLPGDIMTLVGVFMPTPYTGFKAMRAGLIADTYLEVHDIIKMKKSSRCVLGVGYGIFFLRSWLADARSPLLPSICSVCCCAACYIASSIASRAPCC